MIEAELVYFLLKFGRENDWNFKGERDSWINVYDAGRHPLYRDWVYEVDCLNIGIFNDSMILDGRLSKFEYLCDKFSEIIKYEYPEFTPGINIVYNYSVYSKHTRIL